MNAEEASFEETTPEVAVERATDVLRKCRGVVLVGVTKEGGQMLAHDRIEHRALRAMALPDRAGLSGHTRAMAKGVPVP